MEHITSSSPGPGSLHSAPHPIGTHTLGPTDLGWEQEFVGCGNLGRSLGSSELGLAPLKSENNNLLAGVRFRRENLYKILVSALDT